LANCSLRGLPGLCRTRRTGWEGNNPLEEAVMGLLDLKMGKPDDTPA
jgi:hypothetical protein